MKDYRTVYERMDARRKEKMEEAARLDAALSAKEKEIDELKEDIMHLEHELADTRNDLFERKQEYTKLYNEAKRKNLLECISAVIRKAFLIFDNTEMEIEDIEGTIQSKKISTILNEYRHIKRRKDISEHEREQQLKKLNEKLAEETDIFFNLND